jgi:molecular chaperone GrpE (heat shock protein)
LAEAGWAEADLALAQALRDLDEVRAASTRVKRAVALEALELALTRAARRRGMSRIGVTGDEQPFDPALHEAARSAPQRVQIQARGVRRGDAVLVRALVKRLT